MKSVFQNLKYSVHEDAATGNPVQLIIIKNADGTARWICPADTPKPYFLKFYNVSNFKTQVFATLVKLVFFLRLQRLIFRDTQLYMKAASEPIIDVFQNNWAIFMGTAGPNRKALVYQEDKSGSRFYKVATTSKAQQLIAHEAIMTETLAALKVESFCFPHCQTLSSTVLELEDISEKGKRNNILTNKHLATLSEIYAKTITTVTPNYEHLISEVFNLKDKRIPKGMLKKLVLLHNEIKNKPIKVALAHADFTPWNMYERDGSLAIYDWELGKCNMPLGFDAYHFIMQQGILVNRDSWSVIKACIESKLSPAAFSAWTENDNNTSQDYFKWYLFLNVSEHLLLYSQQKNWHPQIEWLFSTWGAALSDVLKTKQEDRKLVIQDTFDWLHNKMYAAIKFPNIQPERLDEYSDIDLCLIKEDAQQLQAYLTNHPLVNKVNARKQSFMTSLQIFMKDGSLLCLDLIWELKRKALIMLEIADIIKRAKPNNFGVKQISIKDLARYVGLFYGLNGQAVPAKYRHYVLALSVCTTDLDKCLYKNCEQNHIPTTELKRLLLQTSYNNPIERIKNRIAYISDKARQILQSKGMIITFSGVDGAGKSTIIENVRVELEKKLRQRVVILRHRPSILPILSAWTKGKAQAEQDAANTLPRQGNNSNTIASLLRFAYYYTDYLFGQFYVYCKYVLRGDILLYDRYYFDFINDSKRSNIQLPKALTRFGYRFLMSADLNFFLYADADTILERKQELDRNTIENLTHSYLDLFKQLGRKKAQRYFAIENIKLAKTIDFIVGKAKAKMA